MIGSTLDKYEVIQKVGEGGMATVYRGRHATLNRDVAIKVLHPHLSSSVRNRKRFAREARAIEHLRHDNILEIYDYSGSDAGECYIVTEFVRGETLTALVDRVGNLPSEIVAMIALELCAALSYAHAAGILHRDLKPDNVMVRPDGAIKLMDFGIARFLHEAQVTMTGTIVGSPHYMSPEQATEVSSLDQRSDLFSLGTMMFFLVSGGLPFTGTNASLILKKIIEGQRPSVLEVAPSMSARLADVIERLLQTRPDDRFPTADAAAEAIAASLAEVDIDPKGASWGLGAWLADPEAWERRHHEHLATTLPARGRALMEAGDALSALRLLNRLLSIDADNAEAITLVQGLHAEPRARRRIAPFAVAALGFAALATGVLWLISGEPAADPDGAVVVRTTEPVGDVPEDPPEVATVVADPPVAVAATTPPVPPAPLVPEPRPPGTKVRRPAPPPAADPPPPLPESRLEFATLEIRSNYPSDVFVDGQRRGDTRQRDPIQLPPGEHQVVLRSEWIQDYAILVDLEPGEKWTPGEVLRLVPKPGVVDLDPAFDAACTVTLDGVVLGTIAERGRAITVNHPEEPHEVSVACGDRTWVKSVQGLLMARRVSLARD